MTKEQIMFALSTAAHECGHMTVLYKSSRLKGLNFFPRRKSFSGFAGVSEADTPELTKADCPAFAASLVGELLFLGFHDRDGSLADDREEIRKLSGSAKLESFVPQAYAVIRENLLFFSLLHVLVKVKIVPVLETFWAGLPQTDKVEIVTLAEVDAVHSKSLDLLAKLK
jgi:hypothetical protein